MANGEVYRLKADELLRLATATSDLGERSRLISEAVRWHMMANEAEHGSASGDRSNMGEQSAPAPDDDPDTPEPDTA